MWVCRDDRVSPIHGDSFHRQHGWEWIPASMAKLLQFESDYLLQQPPSIFVPSCGGKEGHLRPVYDVAKEASTLRMLHSSPQAPADEDCAIMAPPASSNRRHQHIPVPLHASSKPWCGSSAQAVPVCAAWLNIKLETTAAPWLHRALQSPAHAWQAPAETRHFALAQPAPFMPQNAHQTGDPVLASTHSCEFRGAGAPGFSGSGCIAGHRLISSATTSGCVFAKNPQSAAPRTPAPYPCGLIVEPWLQCADRTAVHGSERQLFSKRNRRPSPAPCRIILSLEFTAKFAAFSNCGSWQSAQRNVTLPVRSRYPGPSADAPHG